MGVRIKACHTVRPAEPTWTGVLQLSELDQIGATSYVPTVYFYDNIATKDWLDPPKKIINTLKHSLSRALVPFHPLAGRLQWIAEGGGFQLDCNAMGVELIEADSTKDLSEFGDFSSFKVFKDIIPKVDYGKPIEELPLFLVQVTQFRCGGIGLGVTFSHAIADGVAACNFIREWAKLARGEPLEGPPYLDRRVLQVQDQLLQEISRVEHQDYLSQLPTLIGKENSFEERRKETVATTLILRKDEVERLKNFANTETKRAEDDCNRGRVYSRFEVVAAHIWRCACKARGHKSDQMTALCFCVDSRRRIDPPLPPRYFGNAVIDVVVPIRAGDLMSRHLSHACQRIREENEKVTDSYVRSLIKFLTTQKNSSNRAATGSTEGIFYGNPNLVVASWLSLQFRGLDFGWGKEIHMGPATHDFDGDTMILPGYNDGSIVVVLGLQVAHMEKFKKIFYEDIESY